MRHWYGYVVLVTVALMRPGSACAVLDWIGNVLPCPAADGWLTIHDNAAFEAYVDVYDWGNCPSPTCLGGTRMPGQLGGVSVQLLLVPVRTNLGGEGVPMQYVGDFLEWMPTTRIVDGVDRYRATVPVDMLRRNDDKRRIRWLKRERHVYQQSFLFSWLSIIMSHCKRKSNGTFFKSAKRMVGLDAIDQPIRLGERQGER